jgi:hypothetical protein
MKKWLIAALAMTAFAALTGCSGGGPTSSTKGPCTANCSAASTLTVTLSSASVSTVTPATVTAMVKNGNGAAIAGTVVNFSVNTAIGKLSAPAALTDSSGVATVQLSPATTTSTPSADTLTATATVGTTQLAQSTGYQTSTTVAAFTAFTSGVGSGQLIAYSQTQLAITMSGVTPSTPVTVNLTSDCVTAGKALITPSSVINTTGSMTFTYQDTGGCGAVLSTDTIVASVSGGSIPADNLQISLKAPGASSLTFNTAVPPVIYLKGSGLAESSTVSFKVVDVAGNALPGEQVTMDLSTFAGGLTIDGSATAVTKLSDVNGLVSVIVNSGTVPTPVRVKAALGADINGTTSTVSSVLAVGTGLPTETRFALSQNTINIEGYNYDNAWNGYTVSAADRSGNPVPVGTAITLWAEGGQIPSSVNTALSSNGLSFATASFATQLSSTPADGHVTILAYAIGEESFQDLNGNNVWDIGEPFQDLGDVVKDVRFDGVYTPTDGDEYVSLNGTAHGGSLPCVDDHLLDPLFAVGTDIPSMANTCDGTWTPRVYVRRAVETILSTSSANPIWPDTSLLDGSTCASIRLQPGADPATTIPVYPIGMNSTIYVSNAAGSFIILAADANQVRLNPVAAGTTIAATKSTTMTSASIAGGQPVINSANVTAFAVAYDLGAVPTGRVTINLTSPGPMLQPLGQTRGPQTTTTFFVDLILGPAPTAPTPALCPT